ncbi:RNA polymerase sigma-70 factor [Puteibacter caeruleilacunae]|nr:RNA polymerase sigma-70 factor [Puteibacter caeruleilacunae]
MNLIFTFVIEMGNILVDKDQLTYHFHELKSDSASSFELIFNKMNGQVYAFAFSMLHNDVESKEVVQETFFKLWLHRQKIKDEYTLDAYLFTIARNEVISLIRKKKIREGEDIQPHYAVGNTEEEILFNELKQEVNEIINQLPEKKRLVFKMSRNDGLSNQEIAKQLNISVNTVNNQISSSIRFIREKINKDLLFVIALIIYRL